MPTLSPTRHILAGFAASLLLGACTVRDYEECDSGDCRGQELELGFYDSLGRSIDTLGSAGLSIAFTERVPLGKTAATCVTCEDFILMDSAVLTADRPIVSPEGDTVPARSDLMDWPWEDMLGRVDYSNFVFRPGVRFESGLNAFVLTAPLRYKATRRILSDTAYLAVP